jgi:hypothetical protein
MNNSKPITLSDKLKEMNASDAIALERADVERREILGNDTVRAFDSFLAAFGC